MLFTVISNVAITYFSCFLYFKYMQILNTSYCYCTTSALWAGPAQAWSAWSRTFLMSGGSQVLDWPRKISRTNWSEKASFIQGQGMGTAMKEVKSPCTWTQWGNLRVSYAHGQLVLGIVCISKGKRWGFASSFVAKKF